MFTIIERPVRRLWFHLVRADASYQEVIFQIVFLLVAFNLNSLGSLINLLSLCIPFLLQHKSPYLFGAF